MVSNSSSRSVRHHGRGAAGQAGERDPRALCPTRLLPDECLDARRHRRLPHAGRGGGYITKKDRKETTATGRGSGRGLLVVGVFPFSFLCLIGPCLGVSCIISSSPSFSCIRANLFFSVSSSSFRFVSFWFPMAIDSTFPPSLSQSNHPTNRFSPCRSVCSLPFLKTNPSLCSPLLLLPVFGVRRPPPPKPQATITNLEPLPSRRPLHLHTQHWSEWTKTEAEYGIREDPRAHWRTLVYHCPPYPPWGAYPP